MQNSFSFKAALLEYRTSGNMPRSLYQQLCRLVQIVLRSKGICSQSVYDEVQGAFLEKLLRFQSSFYVRLELHAEKQARSFLSLTVSSVLSDYYRREKGERLTSLDAFEPGVKDALQPEESWHVYRLEAHSIYQQIWQKLSQDLREVFCCIYSAGETIQTVANTQGVSLGKVHKDKCRIAALVAPEASIEEVAQLVYRLMALEFCCQQQSFVQSKIV